MFLRIFGDDSLDVDEFEGLAAWLVATPAEYRQAIATEDAADGFVYPARPR